MSENKPISFTKELLYFSVAMAILVVMAMLFDLTMGFCLLAAAIVFVSVFYYWFIYLKMKKAKAVQQVLAQLRKKVDIDQMDACCVVTDHTGRISWYNNAFLNLANTFPEGKNLFHLMPFMRIPCKDKIVSIGGKSYFKEIYNVEQEEDVFTVYRFINTETATEIKKAYTGYLCVVCYIQIDNYEDLLSDLKNYEQTTVIASIVNVINQFATDIKGIFRQFEKDKFIIVFERKHLSQVMANKFKVLDEIREIKVAKGTGATLSIAVGAGEDPLDSNELAVKALELAQGRGGNQAVVKQADKLLFFGGAQKSVERRSRVKTRSFSNALKNLMEQCSEIFIMGHEVSDLDCMGSAMGLLSCARFVKKTSYIVLDKPNTGIESLLNAMKSFREYDGAIISSSEAKALMSETSMLIIVDTQIAKYTEAPELIGRCETLVVIDHHFRGTEYIEDPSLLYHEPYASSSCELVTEIVQYFDENISLMPLEAEALLAGITIDTKGFSFKTGVRTFEAASYLRRSGADTISIRQLFQDDLKTYSNRVEVVRSARIIKNGIAVSSVPKGMENAALIAAQASDSLLTIRGIAASFVISMQEDTTIISGRSLGSINVQLILEKLGGGGHVTIAGVKLKNKEMDEAYSMLIDAINKYYEEGKEQ
jgi:c-di-AMP phosphodiesterase-like protein